MKDMKIRIGKDLHKGLATVAKKLHRSMNKQVIAYIERGLRDDREEKRRTA